MKRYCANICFRKNKKGHAFLGKKYLISAEKGMSPWSLHRFALWQKMIMIGLSRTFFFFANLNDFFTFPSVLLFNLDLLQDAKICWGKKCFYRKINWFRNFMFIIWKPHSHTTAKNYLLLLGVSTLQNDLKMKVFTLLSCCWKLGNKFLLKLLMIESCAAIFCYFHKNWSHQKV